MIMWWKNLVPRNAVALLRNSGRRELPAKEIREVALFFVDIEGCTRLCEQLPLRETNEIKETYFSEYLDIIRAEGGEVAEVLGDGLLALFEGPDFKENAHAALTAARRIQVLTARLSRRRRSRHDPIIVNIGLNAGPTLTGLTRLRGRSGERWVYSADGPVVNVAARLAALAHGGQALTTKATVDLLGCKCRSIGPHVLKNVTEVIDVVEILLIEDKTQEASGAGTKSGAA